MNQANQKVHCSYYNEKELLAKIQLALKKHGKLSIAELISLNPLSDGFAELLAYKSIAIKVGAKAKAKEQETIIFSVGDKSFKAQIPLFLLEPELFENTEKLNS